MATPHERIPQSPRCAVITIVSFYCLSSTLLVATIDDPMDSVLNYFGGEIDEYLHEILLITTTMDPKTIVGTRVTIPSKKQIHLGQHPYIDEPPQEVGLENRSAAPKEA
ncbi:hypothetical protein TWF696_001576 [Orbilia brochopaga]|uniref:Uncharacterized protein n=1 Tax=Orbilia brochopaga TaxID=3140254 RepID=A0AAV9U933_9PEZI